MQLSFKSESDQETIKPLPALSINRFGTEKVFSLILWVLVGVGILLRLYHFFHNRSLWNDEVFLVNSLIRMDFIELATQPLMYEQKAPIGFLWIVRLSVLIFGKGEMALRLFSLLCGIASLFVFLPVSRYFLKPLGVVVGMGILALASPLLFHSVEAKQYSLELLATTIILYLYIQYHERKDFSSLLQWGIFGAIILWFSYSSIFVLAGMAFGVCLSLLFKKDWNMLFRSFIPFSMWLLSFVVNYFLFTYRHAGEGSEWLVEWFAVRGAFMPLPPSSLADLGWFFHTTYMTLRFSVGLLWIYFTHENQLLQLLMRMPFLPILLGATGLVVFFRKDRKEFMVLLIPILLTLLASGLKLYPFYERLTVFLAPIFILFIALGCQRVVDLFPADNRWKYTLPVLLLAGPVMNSGMEAFNPRLFGEHKNSTQREGFQYVNERFKEGDVVYVYWNNMHHYLCYKEMYGSKFEAIEGKDVKFQVLNTDDFHQQTGPEEKDFIGKKRVWVMYNKYFRYQIGEIEGQPEWYEKGVLMPGEVFYNKFTELGTELDRYDNGEFRIGLFQLPGIK